MRKLLIVLVIIGLLLGCSILLGKSSFTNNKYKYTVTYPSYWQVNSVNIAPPPPAGTTFSGSDLAIYIVVWEQSSSTLAEQQQLKKEGWLEENTMIAGETAQVFMRPQQDTHAGLWKRLYFTQDQLTFEISLDVFDISEVNSGIRVFEDMIQSFRWSN